MPIRCAAASRRAVRCRSRSAAAELLQGWQAHGFEGEAIATSFPCRRSQTGRVPKNLDGAVGYYTNSAETAISKGTYEAAIASMDVALSGADWGGPFTATAAPQTAGPATPRTLN